MHQNAFFTFAKFIQPRITSGMKVLEVAPDKGGVYGKVLRRAGVVVDRWTTNLGREPGDHQLGMDGDYKILVESDTFDAVWSSSVIEHVYEPWTWMRELARVTKPGGFVAVVGPFTWRHHRVGPRGRKRDCWRVLPDGMTVLFQGAGLVAEVTELYEGGTDTDNEMFANRGHAIDVIGIGRKP